MTTFWKSPKERRRLKAIAGLRRRYGSVPIPNGQPIRYPPNIERLMYCWNEFWTASALWRRKDGIWSCVSAAGQVAWMKGKSPAEAKLELARLGCGWQWA